MQEAWLRLERTGAEDDRGPRRVAERPWSPGSRSTRCAPRACGARRTSGRGCPSRWCPAPEDPADRVTLDESVSYALLAVLEQLSPAERTAFVLHDIFDVPFGEVAETVGRSPGRGRQLASRARRHVAQHGPRFEASAEEHDRAVRASSTRSRRAISTASSPSWTPTSSGRPTAAAARSRRGYHCAERAGWGERGSRSAHGHRSGDADRAQRPARSDGHRTGRPSRRPLVPGRGRAHRPHRRRPKPGEAPPGRSGTRLGAKQSSEALLQRQGAPESQISMNEA